MLESLLTGTSGASELTITSFLLCLAASIVIGLLIALVYSYKSRPSKSFLITLTLLPAIVCVVIMMVSGSIGAGVAVAGTFSLVRFRSVPGTAKEICAIFLAMAAGLAAGMGYIGFGFVFVAIVGLMDLLLTRTRFGEKRSGEGERTLLITIPEELDYTGVFDDLFAEYTAAHKLVGVKTTNMGSLFHLTYDLTLRDPAKEKEFIDKLRCRNGNLEISCGIQRTAVTEL